MSIDEFGTNDTWAVNYILQFISTDFQARWCIEKPVTVASLYKTLKGACSPFRFMDLPSHMRKRVLGYLIDTGKDYEEFYHKNDSIRRPCDVEKLCQVSDEFTEAVLELYYSGNSFELYPLMANGPEALQEWASIVGEQHLRHLHSLTATFSYYKGFFDNIRVTYSEPNGLKGEVQEVVDYNYESWESTGGNHIAMIEKRQKDEA